jgi:predicted RNA-binding Zn-ribbon protein involved in translation (DUF1610 family)
MSRYDMFYGAYELTKDGLANYSLSMRPCPECGGKMRTNREGRFVCPGCEYSDIQDVQKLKNAGLDYASEHVGWSAYNFLHARVDDD